MGGDFQHGVGRSGFARRRKEIAKWNAAQRHRKRGLAMTPVKFGISFTKGLLNQAGALVLIYKDGTVNENLYSQNTKLTSITGSGMMLNFLK